MEYNGSRCDWCDKEVSDHYDEKGWIQMIGLKTVTASNGRWLDGVANTKFKRMDSPHILDFCSHNCFLKWFNDKIYFQNIAKGKKKAKAP